MLPNSFESRDLTHMQGRATQAATGVLFLPLVDCTGLGLGLYAMQGCGTEIILPWG